MTSGDVIAPHAALRSATADCHGRVDAAFAGFDLRDRASYAAFLHGHARVLPAIECVLSDLVDLPVFQLRTPCLADDLSSLGEVMPDPVLVPPPVSPAAAWGMLYVIEGSRLGGAFLARTVGPDLPNAYLGAAHERGGWKALLRKLDEAGAAGGVMWMAEAERAARDVFALYEDAASSARESVARST